MEQIIYNPAKEFQSYQSEHQLNCEKEFERLLKIAKVDENLNITTVKTIEKQEKKLNSTKKVIGKYKALRVFLIIMCIVFVLVPVVAFYFLKDLDKFILYISITSSICAILFITFLLLIFLRINKLIKDFSKMAEKIQSEINELTQKAWEQMRPLNNLFYSRLSKNLIESTLGSVKFDNYLHNNKFNFLKSIGLKDFERDKSIVDLSSGELAKNPFVVVKTRIHEMRKKEYTGSLLITWTESYTDSDGNSKTRTRSETLFASVVKPMPFYYKKSSIFYYSEHCPNLSFDRNPSKSRKDLSDKEFQKELNQLDKKAEKAIKNNQKLNLMNNKEFELYFDCFERSNEIEFRMMFSALAQKQLIDLIKAPYFDSSNNFRLKKVSNLSILFNNYIDNLSLERDVEQYKHFSFEKIRNNFMALNMGSFNNFFLAFSPLLAIPIYQEKWETKISAGNPQEQSLSNWEYEAIANKYYKKALGHGNSVTPSILKTSFVKKEGNNEYVNVIAEGYSITPRVDYVLVSGGDGGIHSVPVPWDEYNKVIKESNIVISTLNDDKTSVNSNKIIDSLNEFTSKLSIDTEGMVKTNNILATILGEEGLTENQRILLEKMNNNK
ncbi:MAG1210 family protein [Spiroplasma floricola]|uniref:Uncharacterized protein n=1 Tax=Spiroplasma floricola 23-6 TaxID=1336749 RepID=A0A2K8SEU0_9MOLU|nr:hypothetical protein [Spiroplasma floricola]AUB31933.1 hypothetical protein SFLOR_v1c08850 [Spiroplasma floricola 23-6]